MLKTDNLHTKTMSFDEKTGNRVSYATCVVLVDETLLTGSRKLYFHIV